MRAKDLVKLLEEKIKEHEPRLEMMGELEIVIDKFQKVDDTPPQFNYVGYDPRIELEFDITNGNFILNGFALEKA